VAPVGPPGAVCAQAVDQAGLCARQVAVPDITGVGRQGQRASSWCPFRQTGTVHGLRMGREHGKVDAIAIPVGAQWPRVPRLQRSELVSGVHSSITWPVAADSDDWSGFCRARADPRRSSPARAMARVAAAVVIRIGIEHAHGSGPAAARPAVVVPDVGVKLHTTTMKRPPACHAGQNSGPSEVLRRGGQSTQNRRAQSPAGTAPVWLR
jgi:hypothetical protein